MDLGGKTRAIPRSFKLEMRHHGAGHLTERPTVPDLISGSACHFD